MKEEILAPKNRAPIMGSEGKVFVPDMVSHTWGLLCPVACCAVFCSVLQSLFFFFNFTFRAGHLEFVFSPSHVKSSYMHGPTCVFFLLELMSCTWMTQTKTVEVK